MLVRAAGQEAVKEGTGLVSSGSRVTMNTPEKGAVTKITRVVSKTKKPPPQSYIPTKIQINNNPVES